MPTQPESLVEGEVPALSPLRPENSNSANASEAVAEQDQLPEFEPLTPELVEDEAVRGDFVIRWATVLLALLLGWTQIDDTSLLVRIRNGQQHLLPFGVDPFSASAGDRTWVNLGWLSDSILAGVYRVLGATGLTILGASASALTFWFLSRTSVKGISTWWGSVCAAVALVAVFPQLIPGPTGISLLGVSLVVFLLYRWSEDRQAGFTWQIPATMWVWSQLDSRAWLGSTIILLYAISWFGLRGFEVGDASGKLKNLWKITGASLIAWLLHPLHYHVLLSPLTAYQTEYPEIRAYKVFDWPFAWQWFPVFSVEFQERLNVFSVASLVLCGLALLTFALNFKRLTWEWLLPWGGVVALAALCAHQLPVAALLSCALITINAQLWYRGTFSQKYTVDAMPLAWNRGGRAITVVLMLLLGLVASNGSLMGRNGRRVGSGFSPQLESSIIGAKKLASEVGTQEIFNFRLEQGDLLIWVGLKPYADRRVTLYASGGENLLDKHRALRYAVLVPNSKDTKRGRPEFWKAEFEKLNINHAIPRLSGPSPDYLTLLEMLKQGWSMTSLQSFGAVLSRRDSPDQTFQQYLEQHPDLSFVKLVFQTAAPKTPLTDSPWIFPRRPTVYDNYLWQPQSTLNEWLQLAAHEQELVQMSSTMDESPEMLVTTTALAVSAFRHARQGIILDPQSAKGYSNMARSAGYLHRVESLIASRYQIRYQGKFWLLHSLHAFHHALQLDPDNALDHEQLAALHYQMGHLDLALSHLQQVYRLTNGKYTAISESDPRYIKTQKDNSTLATSLKTYITKVEEAILKSPTQGGTWQDAFELATQGQCSTHALRILEENRTKVAESPEFLIRQVGLLVDVGRTEDALRQAESLARMIPDSGPQASQRGATDIRLMYALSSLAIGDNTQMETLIGLESKLMSEATLGYVMNEAPLTLTTYDKLDLQAASLGYMASQALYTSPERWAHDEFMLAQSEISTWRNTAAMDRLQGILEAEPNVTLRPLIAFYLEMLTGEPQQPISPDQQAAMKKAAEAAKAAQPTGTAVPPTGDSPTTPPAETTPTKTPEATSPPSAPEAQTPTPSAAPGPPESPPPVEPKPE